VPWEPNKLINRQHQQTNRKCISDQHTKKVDSKMTYIYLWTFRCQGTNDTHSIIHSSIKTRQSLTWRLQCCTQVVQVSSNASIQRELQLRRRLLHDWYQIDFVLVNRCKLIIQRFLSQHSMVCINNVIYFTHMHLATCNDKLQYPASGPASRYEWMNTYIYIAPVKQKSSEALKRPCMLWH